MLITKKENRQLFVQNKNGWFMEKWEEELKHILYEHGIKLEEEHSYGATIEVAITITADGVPRLPIDEAIDLITSRLMFALGENINRIAFSLGPNLTYLLARAYSLIIPRIAGNTGYVPIFYPESRKLVCVREE